MPVANGQDRITEPKLNRASGWILQQVVVDLQWSDFESRRRQQTERPLAGWPDIRSGNLINFKRLEAQGQTSALGRERSYPRTLIFENDSTARLAVGRPMVSAGRN